MVFRVLIPFKKTDEANIENYLSYFIREKYSEETLNEHKDSIRSLNGLRSSSLCKHSAKVDPNFEQVAQYYLQLKILQPVISSHEDQSFARVTWYSTIPKGRLSSSTKFAHDKIAFEIANVLHMLGACAFYNASRINFETDEDIKTVIKYFQMAAGIFCELKSLIQTNDMSKLLPDLSVEWADIFIHVALAEAQHGFVKKLMSEENKGAQIAKLSFKIASYFNTALSIFKKIDSRSAWEKDTEKVLSLKYNYNLGNAHFYQSFVEESTSNYGLMLTHLNAAKERISECHKNLSFDLLKVLEEKINSRLTRALEENRMIYRVTVPEVSSLPEFPGLALSKPLPPTSENLLGGKKTAISENFTSLVPLIVRNATNLFMSRLDSLISSQRRKIDEAQQVVDCLLADLSLPSCLEATGSHQMPPSLAEKCASLVSTGGFRSVEANLKLLSDMRQSNLGLLRGIKHSLKEEEDYDSSLRLKYGNRWNRPCSHDVNTSWREIIARYDENIEISLKSDETLRSRFFEVKPFLEMLSQGSDRISKLLDQKASAINTLGPGFRESLLTNYNQVSAIRDRRISLLGKLKMDDKFTQKHFMTLLSSDGTLNVESECDKLISSLNNIIEQIDEYIQKQESNVQFFINAIERVKSHSVDQDDTLIKLFKAYDTYESTRRGISSGIEFYNKLTQHLTVQKSKITDFCYARSLEAEELIKVLDSSNQPFQYQQLGSTTPTAPSYYPSPPPPSNIFPQNPSGPQYNYNYPQQGYPQNPNYNQFYSYQHFRRT